MNPVTDSSYMVLYTHQKTKKAKTWQDGTLKVLATGMKAVLYDDKSLKLDVLHLHASDVVIGEQLESDRYYIQVEELCKKPCSNPELSPAGQSTTALYQVSQEAVAHNKLFHSQPVDQCVAALSESSNLAGLKRKRSAFKPPRLVRPRREEDEESLGVCGFVTNSSHISPETAQHFPAQEGTRKRSEAIHQHSFSRITPTNWQNVAQSSLLFAGTSTVSNSDVHCPGYAALMERDVQEAEGNLESVFRSAGSPTTRLASVSKSSPWRTFGSVLSKLSQVHSNSLDTVTERSFQNLEQEPSHTGNQLGPASRTGNEPVFSKCLAQNSFTSGAGSLMKRSASEIMALLAKKTATDASSISQFNKTAATGFVVSEGVSSAEPNRPTEQLLGPPESLAQSCVQADDRKSQCLSPSDLIFKGDTNLPERISSIVAVESLQTHGNKPLISPTNDTLLLAAHQLSEKSSTMGLKTKSPLSTLHGEGGDISATKYSVSKHPSADICTVTDTDVVENLKSPSVSFSFVQRKGQYSDRLHPSSITSQPVRMLTSPRLSSSTPSLSKSDFEEELGFEDEYEQRASVDSSQNVSDFDVAESGKGEDYKCQQILMNTECEEACLQSADNDLAPEENQPSFNEKTSIFISTEKFVKDLISSEANKEDIDYKDCNNINIEILTPGANPHEALSFQQSMDSEHFSLDGCFEMSFSPFSEAVQSDGEDAGPCGHAATKEIGEALLGPDASFNCQHTKQADTNSLNKLAAEGYCGHLEENDCHKGNDKQETGDWIKSKEMFEKEVETCNKTKIEERDILISTEQVCVEDPGSCKISVEGSEGQINADKMFDSEAENNSGNTVERTEDQINIDRVFGQVTEKCCKISVQEEALNIEQLISFGSQVIGDECHVTRMVSEVQETSIRTNTSAELTSQKTEAIYSDIKLINCSSDSQGITKSAKTLTDIDISPDSFSCHQLIQAQSQQCLPYVSTDVALAGELCYLDCQHSQNKEDIQIGSLPNWEKVESKLSMSVNLDQCQAKMEDMFEEVKNFGSEEENPAGSTVISSLSSILSSDLALISGSTCSPDSFCVPSQHSESHFLQDTFTHSTFCESQTLPGQIQLPEGFKRVTPLEPNNSDQQVITHTLQDPDQRSLSSSPNTADVNNLQHHQLENEGHRYSLSPFLVHRVFQTVSEVLGDRVAKDNELPLTDFYGRKCFQDPVALSQRNSKVPCYSDSEGIEEHLEKHDTSLNEQSNIADMDWLVSSRLTQPFTLPADSSPKDTKIWQDTTTNITQGVKATLMGYKMQGMVAGDVVQRPMAWRRCKVDSESPLQSWRAREAEKTRCTDWQRDLSFDKTKITSSFDKSTKKSEAEPGNTLSLESQRGNGYIEDSCTARNPEARLLSPTDEVNESSEKSFYVDWANRKPYFIMSEKQKMHILSPEVSRIVPEISDPVSMLKVSQNSGQHIHRTDLPSLTCHHHPYKLQEHSGGTFCRNSCIAPCFKIEDDTSVARLCPGEQIRHCWKMEGMAQSTCGRVFDETLVISAGAADKNDNIPICTSSQDALTKYFMDKNEEIHIHSAVDRVKNNLDRHEENLLSQLLFTQNPEFQAVTCPKRLHDDIEKKLLTASDVEVLIAENLQAVSENVQGKQQASHINTSCPDAGRELDNLTVIEQISLSQNKSGACKLADDDLTASANCTVNMARFSADKDVELNLFEETLEDQFFESSKPAAAGCLLSAQPAEKKKTEIKIAVRHDDHSQLADGNAGSSAKKKTNRPGVLQISSWQEKGLVKQVSPSELNMVFDTFQCDKEQKEEIKTDWIYEQISSRNWDSEVKNGPVVQNKPSSQSLASQNQTLPSDLYCHEEENHCKFYSRIPADEKNSKLSHKTVLSSVVTVKSDDGNCLMHCQDNSHLFLQPSASTGSPPLDINPVSSFQISTDHLSGNSCTAHPSGIFSHSFLLDSSKCSTLEPNSVYCSQSADMLQGEIQLNTGWDTSYGHGIDRNLPFCQCDPDTASEGVQIQERKHTTGRIFTAPRKLGLSKLRKPVNLSVGTHHPNSLSSLCQELQFFSREELDSQAKPSRQVFIPSSFDSVLAYRQILSAALKEFVNLQLFDVAMTYHAALSRVEVPCLEGVDILETKATVSSNPKCKCGGVSKLIQVKKEGPNKGRFFYACSAPREKQCKFFQWVSQLNQCSTSNREGVSSAVRPKLSDSNSIMDYFHEQKLSLYCQCKLVWRLDNHHFKQNFLAWVQQNQNDSVNTKKSVFIHLPRRKSLVTTHAKDDLWVVSRSLRFARGETFVSRSSFHGPNSQGEIAVEPVDGLSSSLWTDGSMCHALHCGNAATELMCLANLQEHLDLTSIPVLPDLLGIQQCTDQSQTSTRRFKAPLKVQDHGKFNLPGQLVLDLAGEFISKYGLNADQAVAVHKVANMVNKDADPQDSVLLVHGVFGAGKSFLLSILILFLVEFFQRNDSYSPGIPFPWKVLLSSTTNIAVDRVLQGLLDHGYEDFVRVGSVKKIAKPVLPYSVHASGSESQELKDLQQMLKNPVSTPAEKHFVRKSIERHKLGQNRKRLGAVRVVGVTCAACNFQCLEKMNFPFVVLDECSQMTEPLSLVPIARFGCEKLMLVGDPKQLDPALQCSDAAHRQGLEQTLFDRLIKMGYEAVMLRTQYRCHPIISAVSNSLFYQHQLVDGVKPEDRPPLLNFFPTLCFYDISNGEEQNDSNGSFFNDAEAQFVVLLLSVLVTYGIRVAAVGVITLYKAQARRIMDIIRNSKFEGQLEMADVQISTVDAFQGGERDIIILSCVRTRSLGFIDSDKRMNVALTRARHHLLIVGHKPNLISNKLWKQVISHCQDVDGGVVTSSVASKMLRAILDQWKDSHSDAISNSASSHTAGSVKEGKRQKTHHSSSGTNFESSDCLSSLNVPQQHHQESLMPIPQTELEKSLSISEEFQYYAESLSLSKSSGGNFRRLRLQPLITTEQREDSDSSSDDFLPDGL